MVSAAINGTGKSASADSLFPAGSAKITGSNSFGDVMAKSIADSASKTTMANSKEQPVNVSVQASSDKTSKTDGDAGQKISSAENDVSNTSVKSTSTETVDNSSTVSDDDAAKLDEAGKRVFEEIKKLLGLTDEEAQEVMTTLGLAMSDLLLPENVTQFVMQATGITDAMMLITDDALSSSMKSITSFLAEQTEVTASQLGVTVDELRELAAVSDTETVQADVQQSDDVINMQQNTESVRNEISETSETDARQNTLEQAIGEKLTAGTQQSGRESAMQRGSGQTLGENTDGSAMSEQAGTANLNVTQSIAESFAAAFDSSSGQINPADVVRQVVDSIRLNATQGLQSMEIQLTPENLGKVNILVSVREGVVTAQLNVQNEQVKKALENQLLTLKENFENQGIKVETVEITVHTNAFESNQNFSEQKEQSHKAGGTRKINLDDLSFDEEENSEEQERTYISENSSVEFSA